MGSYSGGLIACYIALLHQALFEKAACFSPAFVKSWVGEHWLKYIQVTGNQKPMKIHIDMGDSELGLYGEQILVEMLEVYNTFLVSGFNQQQVRYQVIQGGTHDETSWRSRTLEILHWLND